MIKFALVGCGRISRRYLELLGKGQIPNATITAVCDTQDDRAQKAKADLENLGLNSIKAHTDMHQMMRESGSDIDVVAVLTESGNHARNAVELSEYGKHLVVEKPMALTLSDADEMIRACDNKGIKLFIVKQNRYNLPVVKLREAFDKGRFGRIVMGTVRVRWCRDQSYYDQDAWRGTWGMDGGVFTNQASHHIDLLEWFLGQPVSVFAKSRRALVDIEAEDTGVAVIQFESGAIGVVEATTATRPKDLEGSLSILGESGTVEIGGFAVNDIKVWNFTDSADQATAEEDKIIMEQFSQNPPNVYGFGHKEYLTEVVDSIECNQRALVGGLEGRKSLELITAIYESIETGREIPIRFQPTRCKLGNGNGLKSSKIIPYPGKSANS